MMRELSERERRLLRKQKTASTERYTIGGAVKAKGYRVAPVSLAPVGGEQAKDKT